MSFCKILIYRNRIDLPRTAASGGGARLPCVRARADHAFVNFPWRHAGIRLAAFARLVHPGSHSFLVAIGTPTHDRPQPDRLAARAAARRALPPTSALQRPASLRLRHGRDRTAPAGWWPDTSANCPRPGAASSQMVGKWPVLIVKGRDGEIRAFHNTCRHRGSILCAAGKGAAPKIVCPYHRWTYELDGSLLSATRMEAGFRQGRPQPAPDPARARRRLPVHLLRRQPAAVQRVCASGSRNTLRRTTWRIAEVRFRKHDHRIRQLEAGDERRERYHCATRPPGTGTHVPGRHEEALSTSMAIPRCRPSTSAWLRSASPPKRSKAIGGSSRASRSIRRSCRCSMDGKHLVKKLMCDLGGCDLDRCASRSIRTASCTPPQTTPSVQRDAGWPARNGGLRQVAGSQGRGRGCRLHRRGLVDLWTRTNLQDKELAENNQLG